MDAKTLSAAALYIVCVAAMSSYRNYGSFSFSSLSEDPILSCLETNRRINWEKRQERPTTAEGEYPVSPHTYVPVTASELPKICQDGDLGKFKSALQKQLERYAKIRPELHAAKKFKLGCTVYSRQEYSVEVAKQMLAIVEKSGSFPAFIARVEQEFDWYRNIGRLEDSTAYPSLKKGTMQFTAYYLPEPLEAQRNKSDEFRYPFYRQPPGLENVLGTDGDCGRDVMTGKKIAWCLKKDGRYLPLPKRKQIDAEGALSGLGLEIGFVRDPIDIAFLMIQGSGSLLLRESEGAPPSKVRINYAGQNGGVRYMLASILKCAGARENEYSGMTAIRNFLNSKGDGKFKYMNYDETYIFFDESDKGPFGVEDIQITERQSLATDPTVIPTGAVTLFTVERPEGAVDGCQDITSMAIAQDVGGAITGAHVDWYQGEGLAAGKRADKVNNPGILYVAAPKNMGREVIDCQP